MTEPVDFSTSALSYLHSNMSEPLKILDDGRFNSLYRSLCTISFIVLA